MSHESALPILMQFYIRYRFRYRLLGHNWNRDHNRSALCEFYAIPCIDAPYMIRCRPFVYDASNRAPHRPITRPHRFHRVRKNNHLNHIRHVIGLMKYDTPIANDSPQLRSRNWTDLILKTCS